MNRDFPCTEAVGICGGKIVFAGSRAEARALCSPSTEILDYGDAAILPGFIDTHVHVLPSGIFEDGVDLSEVKCLDELFFLLRQRAAQIEPGAWIFGTAFQDKKILEKRFPTRKELDAVSSQNPIFICHNDMHPFAFNSAALELLKPDPNDDGVETAPDGSLTGIITDPACMPYMARILDLFPDEILLKGCKRIDEYAVSRGVTTVFGKDCLRVLKLREQHKEDFSVEFVPMWMSQGCDDEEGLNELIADPVLSKKACVCVFADGSFDCYSASVSNPYEGRPTSFGMLLNTNEKLYQFLLKAHQNGLQISCHAIGDHAIEQVLKVYEAIQKKAPRPDARMRIEHFEQPSKASIKKAAELSVALGMQPLLIEICEGMDFSGYSCFIGERAKECSPYRSILDAGILIGGGSDYPVTPLEILRGARVCMQNPNPNERISLMECLELNTVNAAKLGFLEHRKGMIAPGMDADLVVLEKNPFAAAADELDDIKIEATYCGGKLAYEA